MSLSLIEELELQVIALSGNDRAHCAGLVEQAIDALKAQPGGVVLPERAIAGNDQACLYVSGRNHAIEEMASLNSSTASAGDPFSCEHAACQSLGEHHPFCGYVKQVSAGGVDERAADAIEQAIGLIGLVEHQPPVLDQARRILVKLAAQLAAALTANVRCQVCADTGRVHEPGQPEGDCRACVEAGRVSSASAPNHSEQVRDEWASGFKLHEIYKALDSGLPMPNYWAETCDGEPHVHTKLWRGLPGSASFHSSRFWPLYGVSMLAAAPSAGSQKEQGE